MTNGMTVVYALENPPETYEKSIFLAGPTPRSQDVKSWRPYALKLLKYFNYDGVVFVPEDRPDEFGVTTFHGNYDGQVDWEERCLNLADVILFWVPREMETMPALTTNVEWGKWQSTGKVVFGAPETAQKVRYLIHDAVGLNVPCALSLYNTVENAVQKVGKGASRTGGEREVPLYIWHTPSFQSWYESLKKAGNELCRAHVEWTFRVGPKQNIVFLWALHVDIYVTAENRYKTNEVVIGRPDISTVVAHTGRGDDARIALVREFRSPVNNDVGYVYEAPGGSSFKPGKTPEVLGAEELHEETGLRIDPERFRLHEQRQLNATLSTHRSFLMSVELTSAEMDYLEFNHGKVHGVEEDSERTYVEVYRLHEIRSNPNIDWSMLGMILQVVL